MTLGKLLQFPLIGTATTLPEDSLPEYKMPLPYWTGNRVHIHYENVVLAAGSVKEMIHFYLRLLSIIHPEFTYSEDELTQMRYRRALYPEEFIDQPF